MAEPKGTRSDIPTTYSGKDAMLKKQSEPGTRYGTNPNPEGGNTGKGKGGA